MRGKPDPVLARAFQQVRLSALLEALPAELTMWVDPGEVAYRIGHDGSICHVFDSAPAPTPASPKRLSPPIPLSSMYPPQHHAEPFPPPAYFAPLMHGGYPFYMPYQQELPVYM